MSVDVAIVADDLTGACDSAVQFARAGWPTELRLHGGPSEAEVVAVTTDSRAHTATEAAGRVRNAVADLLGSGATRFFKKIDSTLRGQVRPELDAVLDTLPGGIVALVCPAFPDVGRTVVDGRLLVDGCPVNDTVIGHDPVTPVSQSHLPTLLDAPLVRLDPHESQRDWARQVHDAGRVVVLDAATNDDLDRIARTVIELGPRALAVGSGGLAAPLAQLWRPRTSPGTTLVVVTSANDASRAQACRLTEHSAVRHEPSRADLTDPVAWASFTTKLLESATTRPPALLISAPERIDTRLCPELVARRIAEAAAEVVRSGEIAGLVVTGGDGARALLAQLDATGIRLAGQVEPGVALGTLVGGWAAGLTVATKAGGFGGTDVLITTAHAVRMQRSTR